MSQVCHQKEEIVYLKCELHNGVRTQVFLFDKLLAVLLILECVKVQRPCLPLHLLLCCLNSRLQPWGEVECQSLYTITAGGNITIRDVRTLLRGVLEHLTQRRSTIMKSMDILTIIAPSYLIEES